MRSIRDSYFLRKWREEHSHFKLNLLTVLASGYLSRSGHMYPINKIICYLLILFAATMIIIVNPGLMNATEQQQQQQQRQQQQQQALLNQTTDDFTLNIDVLDVNPQTRNSTISISGAEGESLIHNKTIDLLSEAQQQYPGESNPVAVTIPIKINSSLIYDGDEIKACLTMADSTKVDCHMTVITESNVKGFPKSISLTAGGSIEEQITELPK
jgi:type II secretory pathway pseudopilin PulG